LSKPPSPRGGFDLHSVGRKCFLPTVFSVPAYIAARYRAAETASMHNLQKIVFCFQKG